MWNITEDYLEGTFFDFKINEKIASFDLDSTLIETKSKKKFAKDASDWKWIYDNVPSKLKQLVSDGYSIVIVSNQGGLSTNDKIKEWSDKVNQIAKDLGIPLKVLAAVSHGKFRKPCTGFVEKFFPDFTKESFYCGDAAGRNGDFSDTDYKFAVNAKLTFYVPEELFLGKKSKLPAIDYCIDFDKKNKYKTKVTYDIDPMEKEMIIMVGYPGSGKSSFSQYMEKKFNYCIVNQDKLGTLAKCKKEAISNIEKKKSFIIDSTNSSKEKRKEWIELAKGSNYKVRIVQIMTSIEISKHNNIYRHLTTGSKIIPDIAYHMYKKNFEEPSIDEGVSEVEKIEPIFPNDDNYYKYMY
jgi:bifunctional polynucleotide phosphatase/kinase